MRYRCARKTGGTEGRGLERKRERENERKKGWEEDMEGEKKKNWPAAQRCLLFSLFHGYRVYARARFQQNSEIRRRCGRHLLRPPPKGAFIFISIMGHRDVYGCTACSTLSLRSFIIINSTGPRSFPQIRVYPLAHPTPSLALRFPW